MKVSFSLSVTFILPFATVQQMCRFAALEGNEFE